MTTHHSTRFDGPPAATSLGMDYVLQVLRRRKWIGLLVSGATVAATIGVVLSLPNLYKATATVLVDRDLSQTIVRPSITAELDTRIQTIHQRITSRERLSALITELGLYPALRRTAPMDAAVERMRRDVQLKLKGVDQANGRTETIAFGLTYNGRDAELVARVANTLVASYIAENAQSRERQATGTADVVEQQVLEARAALDAQERRTTDFIVRHGTQLAPQLPANTAALDRAAAELRANGDAQLRAIDRRERLQAAAVTAAEAKSRTPPLDSPAAQLAKLKRELADLRRLFKDGYPEITRVQEEIAALEPQVGPAGPEIPPVNPAIAEIDAELRQLKDQAIAMRRTAGTLDARIQDTPAWQGQLEELSRGHTEARDRYQTLLKQYTDARLSANLEQGQRIEQFRVLDPAVPPLVPTAPDRPTLALMGLALALALGLGAMFLREKTDTSFHTADDLAAFVGLPVLATIRQISTPRAVRRSRWRGAAMTLAALVMLALIGAGAFYYAAGNEHLVTLTARGGM